ncbi:hypothetical protein BC826DRAFT_927183 [Russula brevipes]|nr:hypothetical protein BC826DRAFT_927183 [Russula brevipes]
MPVDEPFNVYREQLTSLYLGLALWDPVPDSTINHRVSIGDVGFVREGAFSRMFNVILKHDHPSNQKIGKPDHYVPLHLDPFVNSRKSTLNKGDYRSRHVSTEEYNPVTATPNDDLTYECPGIGAVLYLPAKGDREDVLRTKVFEDYIRDNVGSWFAWSQKNGLGVERTEDLILVTGCTLAKSWAIAAFCDPTTESKVSLSVQSQSDGRESFTWRNVHGSVMNGNSPHDPVRFFVYFYSSCIDLACIETNPQPAPNQCVFIKGFRAKRVLFWTTTLRAAAEPLPDDPDNRDEDEIQVTSVPYAPNVSSFAVGRRKKKHDTLIPVSRPARRCFGLYRRGSSL